MKINFTLDVTPEEISTLAKAEVETQRIREEVRRDANFEREYNAVSKRIDEARKRLHDEIAEFEREYERVSKEIREASTHLGEL